MCQTKTKRKQIIRNYKKNTCTGDAPVPPADDRERLQQRLYLLPQAQIRGGGGELLSGARTRCLNHNWEGWRIWSECAFKRIYILTSTKKKKKNFISTKGLTEVNLSWNNETFWFRFWNRGLKGWRRGSEQRENLNYFMFFWEFMKC